LPSSVLSKFDQKLHVDDTVRAVALHRVNGCGCVLSPGLFADGSYSEMWNGVSGAVRGLFCGDAGQSFAQVIGVAACFAFVFMAMYLLFKISNRIVPTQVVATDKCEWPDLREMGIKGYKDLTAPGRG
jgi:Amt family ammonium transporter